jgi:hypothetical protein
MIRGSTHGLSFLAVLSCLHLPQFASWQDLEGWFVDCLNVLGCARQPPSQWLQCAAQVFLFVGDKGGKICRLAIHSNQVNLLMFVQGLVSQHDQGCSSERHHVTVADRMKAI